MSSQAAENRPAHPRTRGRPLKTEADYARVRLRILDATQAAYGDLGYHALNVNAILERAGLSRPTFYRHFNNLDEVVRLVIARACEGLVDRFVNRIPTDASVKEKMAHAVELYLEWGESIGSLLRPLYVELHDPLSPVSELRPQVLVRIGDLYRKTVETEGLRIENDLLVDLMVTGIEFLGYRYLLERNSGRITKGMIKDAMSRLVACTLRIPA
ncbi:TetR/AcrR family transcriptional regulator [Noviherbaspirillum galbum]|uniref:TetR/AcrR family transcriptional regulator n=1 Tax=Noviherbaspirillum galbum TaxID=2709383 RepID=A0A6B3SLS0_9BURK|nr:TetR/AcrR family transcriptional regulator [Noviherbaspirillum galbum]NEX59586.1 TetR/AcrR family transcriptional regulator [Noviherbaspirillum galbum]